MVYPEKSLLDQSVRRVLRIQLVAAALVLAVTGSLALLPALPLGAGALAAAAYGCALGFAGTLLSARSVRRTSADAEDGAGLVPIFSGLVNKLFIVGGGIAFGLIVLGLEPMLTVTGYFVVQMASIWALLKPD